MSLNKINVYNILNDSSPISEADGKKLYDEINRYFENNEHVLVDFSNIISLTTAVVNNSISAFVVQEGITNLAKHLKITGLEDTSIKNTINLSLSLAQKKYEATQNELREESD